MISQSQIVKRRIRIADDLCSFLLVASFGVLALSLDFNL